MIVIADIETNGLTPDKIHVVCLKVFRKKGVSTFTDMNKFKAWVKKNSPSKWVFHNGLGFDVPVINNLVEDGLIDPKDVLDTFVVSRTVNYSAFSTHSLDELGRFLKVLKGSYTGGWDKCSPEMIAYCQQDVLVGEAILEYFWKQIVDKDWSDALRLEHDMATICHQMGVTGFSFDTEKAEELLEEIKSEMSVLEESFMEAFGTKEVEDKRIKLRYKDDGTLYKNVSDTLADPQFSRIEIDTENKEVVCYVEQQFKPGSPKERIDQLWKAGWKPFEKTKGHITLEREARRKMRR